MVNSYSYARPTWLHIIISIFIGTIDLKHAQKYRLWYIGTKRCYGKKTDK